MESPNLNVKSAKAQKCKNYGFRQSQTCEIRRLKEYKIKKMQIIAAKFVRFRKNPYLCNIVAKLT